jgi:hypothetical protein
MNHFKWRHFKGEIILWAVRWYCKYGISYRELEEMMSERGIDVGSQHHLPLGSSLCTRNRKTLACVIGGGQIGIEVGGSMRLT